MGQRMKHELSHPSLLDGIVRILCQHKATNQPPVHFSLLISAKLELDCRSAAPSDTHIMGKYMEQNERPYTT